MSKKQSKTLSREEELKALESLNEKIRLDPDLGMKLLQEAGIYDENRQLTEPYRAK